MKIKTIKTKGKKGRKKSTLKVLTGLKTKRKKLFQTIPNPIVLSSKRSITKSDETTYENQKFN